MPVPDFHHFRFLSMTRVMTSKVNSSIAVRFGQCCRQLTVCWEATKRTGAKLLFILDGKWKIDEVMDLFYKYLLLLLLDQSNHTVSILLLSLHFSDSN